jgi:chromosomal replication initiator protein DnaA
MKSLEPLGDNLGHEAVELASVLRQLFESLGLSLRRYAARRNRDAGAVSRYLNGTRLPTWEFIADLIKDVSEIRGPMTSDAVTLLRERHAQALAASGSPQHRVQFLELQLADADRAARRGALRERAIEEALLEAQHRVADLELQLRQLPAAPSPGLSGESEWMQSREFSGLRLERDRLQEQVDDLQAELKDAHIRRIDAEKRCQELEQQIENIESEDKPDSDTGPKELPSTDDHSTTDDPEFVSGLSRKYTFDNFAVDSKNKFPYEAVVRVSELPVEQYNPLYIQGGSGRGKTHLLIAAGHYHHTIYPKSKVSYISLSEFSRQSKRLSPRSLHGGIGMLLIDGLESLLVSQTASFHELLSTAIEREIQVVITSTHLPGELPEMTEEISHSIGEGLILKMEAPQPKKIFDIIGQKLHGEGLMASPEALTFIANHSGSSLRELEGALARIVAHCRLYGTRVDIKAIRESLHALSRRGHKEISGEDVLVHVAANFDVTVEDLRAKTRGRALVSARHIAMYLCRELTENTVPTIAALLGSKDLAAVLHAHKKTKTLMSERASVYSQISEITKSILG